MHPCLLRGPRAFPLESFTSITRIGEDVADTGIDFGILTVPAGRKIESQAVREGALLLLSGELSFELPGGATRRVSRGSLFRQDPVALHFPEGFSLRLTAHSDCELAGFGVENDALFEPMLFDGSNMLESEQRDKGRWDDAAHRIVRTIFDIRNRPEAKLVLGEVVNSPGRWSSYPPHHHPQPEIYHYRFDRPQGYGHAELGEQVFKVRHGDTVKILDLNDHSQCAAPGYGMYYIWAIRHLPGEPYTVPEFTEEHRWLLEQEPE